MAALQGKTAFITGASRGIGRAIAERFAAEGAAVVLSASRLGEHEGRSGTLQGAVDAITSAGGRATPIVCDLTDPTARDDLIARVSEPFGAPDIIVNNAAGSKMAMPSQVSRKHRNMMLDLNLNAPVDIAQQALPAMQQKGEGWILNISSSTAEQPAVPYRDSPEAAHAIGAYGASKAALNRYSEALAHELAGTGIRVNTLAPESIVMTEGAAYVRDIAQNNPDMVEPVEMMAEAALALCSGSDTGRVTYSRQLVHSLGLAVRSLDAQQVLGDALMPGIVE